MSRDGSSTPQEKSSAVPAAADNDARKLPSSAAAAFIFSGISLFMGAVCLLASIPMVSFGAAAIGWSLCCCGAALWCLGDLVDMANAKIHEIKKFADGRQRPKPH